MGIKKKKQSFLKEILISEQIAIRNQYAALGVETYYLEKGIDYKNPHFDQIKNLIESVVEKLNLTDQILDFSCGNGEVSQILVEKGYQNVIGSDPFLHQNYISNIGKICYDYSFEDVIKGKLSEMQFSAIICSFAMHLCEPKQLYPLISNLYETTNQLVIITPHKKPELEHFPIHSLFYETFALTERGKKVTLKIFNKK